MFTFSPRRRQCGAGLTSFAGRSWIPRQRGGGNALTRRIRDTVNRAKSFVLSEAAYQAKSMNPAKIINFLIKGKRLLNMIQASPGQAMATIGTTLAKESLQGLNDVVANNKNPRVAFRDAVGRTLGAQYPKGVKPTKNSSVSAKPHFLKRKLVHPFLGKKKKKKKRLPDIFDA